MNAASGSEDMTTVVKVLECLHERGWDNELKMVGQSRMYAASINKIYHPEDLLLVKTYRFEGDSNPSDSSVIYVMEDKEGNRSYVFDAYGIYTSHEEKGFEEFLIRVPRVTT